MRKISILVLAFVLLVNNAYGSPLIFTGSKEVQTGELTEIASIDTAKYKQIRIAIENDSGILIENTPAYGNLIAKRVEAVTQLSELKQTLKERHPDVLKKQAEIDLLNETIGNLKKSDLDSNNVSVSILAVENGKEIELVNSQENRSKRSFVIDTPPTKLKIYAKGRGKFTIYVWGQ